MQQQ
jgi:hypothetical protein